MEAGWSFPYSRNDRPQVSYGRNGSWTNAEGFRRSFADRRKLPELRQPFLVVEQEFLGIDQRPEDILVGKFGIVLMLLNVCQGDLNLIRLGVTGIHPAV